MLRRPVLVTRLSLLLLSVLGLQPTLQAADDQLPVDEVRIAAIQYEIQGTKPPSS